MPTKRKYPYNRERLLLTALVAVTFFGFLLWSIEQTASEQEDLLTASAIISFPNSNRSIRALSPKIGAAIKSPVVISGRASVFEAVLQARIKDASGLTLAQTKIMAKEGQKMSPFSASVKYKKPTRPKGTIEVFSLSAKDGSEINKITIPVVFKD
ncbi:MAG: Gmad2 immunoglobulin-like domain-containing protein [Candidatus Portnoybacteria bacterium]|nr:Gmad2 immunoglobulin-like domain-containing protein [Candidatus Portnoybacteria bacterium]MDD4982924.1 Gmad2 immunoglobulin-like domain-containing protein [Candidatus Portnoybacteria bacterium]